MHLSSYVPFFFYELWTKMHKDGGASAPHNPCTSPCCASHKTRGFAAKSHWCGIPPRYKYAQVLIGPVQGPRLPRLPPLQSDSWGTCAGRTTPTSQNRDGAPRPQQSWFVGVPLGKSNRKISQGQRGRRADAVEGEGETGITPKP
jgi:hypothetical protein